MNDTVEALRDSLGAYKLVGEIVCWELRLGGNRALFLEYKTCTRYFILKTVWSMN